MLKLFLRFLVYPTAVVAICIYILAKVEPLHPSPAQSQPNPVDILYHTLSAPTTQPTGTHAPPQSTPPAYAPLNEQSIARDLHEQGLNLARLEAQCIALEAALHCLSPPANNTDPPQSICSHSADQWLFAQTNASVHHNRYLTAANDLGLVSLFASHQQRMAKLLSALKTSTSLAECHHYQVLNVLGKSGDNLDIQATDQTRNLPHSAQLAQQHLQAAIMAKLTLPHTAATEPFLVAPSQNHCQGADSYLLESAKDLKELLPRVQSAGLITSLPTDSRR